MPIRILLLTLLPLLTLARPAAADAPPPLQFVEFTTAGAAADAPLPLIIAIHGLGDRPERFAALLKDLPVAARVVVPRAPAAHGRGFSWFPVRVPVAGPQPGLEEGLRASTTKLAALARHLSTTRPTVGRPTVTGFSQGGMLSFALAAAHPDVFAAALPVAGALPRSMWPAKGAPTTRVRAFHGDVDRVIAVDDARDLMRHLTANGWDATLGTFQGVGHAVPPMMRASLHAELAAAVRRAALKPAAAPAP